MEFLQLFCTQQSRDGAGTDTDSERVNTTITENTQERDTQSVCHIATNRDCITVYVPEQCHLCRVGGRGSVVTMVQWWNGTDRGN